MKITLVLLPGLNGTEGLFKPLIDSTPENFDVFVITYPTHVKMTYTELTAFVLERLKSIEGKYIILGESYSGPLSLFVSESDPEGLVGVILVASFITAPNIKAARFLPWGVGFLLVKPLYNLRLKLSKTKNASFIQSISAELQKVAPEVLAFRMHQIFSVSATDSLKNSIVPVMYFRGIKDFVVPQRNLNNIVRVKPDVEVINFDTQHFLLQSAPKAAWSAIQRFAKKCA